jgi:phosphoribosylformylglycinamidine synthase
VYGLLRGLPPAIDLAKERALQALLPSLAADRLIQSAHDVSEGGIAVTLAECCFDTGGRGATVDLPALLEDSGTGVSPLAAALFGESVPQVVVSVTAEKTDEVIGRARAAGIAARVIGSTGGAALVIRIDGQPAITLSIAEAEHIWATAIESKLSTRATAVA